MKITTVLIRLPAILFLTAVLLLAALFTADLFVFPFMQGKFSVKVPMPDLRLMDSLSAVKAISKAGLKLGEITRQLNDSVPKGRVVSQIPLPGEEVKEKRRIQIILSLGREMVVVPDLKTLSPSEASDTLQRLGLHLGETREINDDRLTPGSIISTSPVAGRKLLKGGVVNIIISQNNMMNETYVPDCQNVSLEQAKAMLGKAFLRLRQVSYKRTPDVLPRTVT